MRIVSLVAAATIGLFFAGCSDVCEDLADIECEGVETSSDSSDSESDAECTGEAEKFAECAVDNEEAYCESLRGEAGADNAFVKCTTEEASE